MSEVESGRQALARVTSRLRRREPAISTPPPLTPAPEKKSKRSKSRENLKGQLLMPCLPTPSETDIVGAILQILKFQRCLVWRCNTGGMRRGGQYVAFGLGTGGADIVGLTRHGRFFALEVKDDEGKLSPDQKEWRRKVIEMNGYVALARSPMTAVRALREAEAGLPSPPEGVEP